MIYFLKGIVRFIKENFIVLEVHDIGYQVYVSKTTFYHIDDEIFLYTYQITKQEDQYILGFKEIEEKNAFTLLLRVSGIGPKGAMNILRQVEIDDMYAALKNENADYFASLDGVSRKTANQIILDLKNRAKHFVIKENASSNSQKDVKEALLQLGFKPNSIDAILPKLDYSKPIEVLLKEALAIIRKL